MSSRFLIPVLCVGAVAFACGPRAHNEATSAARQKNSGQKNGTVIAQSAGTAAIARQQGVARAPRKPSESPLDAQLYVSTADSKIRLALHVVNTSRKRIELTFPSGQTYDFIVLDSLGRELWRWGSGRMFTQALRNKQLSGGEALDLEETWATASLQPGRYTARAILTSENYPLVEQAEFLVTGSTFASR